MKGLRNLRHWWQHYRYRFVPWIVFNMKDRYCFTLIQVTLHPNWFIFIIAHTKGVYHYLLDACNDFAPIYRTRALIVYNLHPSLFLFTSDPSEMWRNQQMTKSFPTVRCYQLWKTSSKLSIQTHKNDQKTAHIMGPTLQGKPKTILWLMMQTIVIVIE